MIFKNAKIEIINARIGPSKIRTIRFYAHIPYSRFQSTKMHLDKNLNTFKDSNRVNLLEQSNI